MRWSRANPRIALKLRRWRSRFGISAPRVAVRTHVSWHWRVLVWGAVLAASLATAGWIYDAGRRFAGFDVRESEQEIRILHGRVAELDVERQRLRSLADTSESKLQIELAAQQQLTRQIKTLEAENAQLKEDLSLFESLAQTETRDSGVSIPRLRIELEDAAANQYRYRMLVALQGGRKDKEFKGDYQLVLNLLQDGRSVVMTLPAAAEPALQKFHLSFKYFQRLEGGFRIPANARIKSVEARLLQQGTLLVSRVATL